MSQGDVYQASLDWPWAIAVVDGYFERVPAVWHKELLWALPQGIHVLGAASMGALRAAELSAFGMVGVGRIFEAFRDGLLTDDDEVAVRHAPAEHGFRAMSEALVNIRATLDEAARARILSVATGAALASMAKELFYADRTYRALLQKAGEAGMDEGELERLRAWLPGGAD